MNINHDKLKRLLTEDAFIISNHARTRMFQRDISTENVIEVIINGQIIETTHKINHVLQLCFLHIPEVHPVTL